MFLPTLKLRISSHITELQEQLRGTVKTDKNQFKKNSIPNYSYMKSNPNLIIQWQHSQTVGLPYRQR